MTRLQKNKAAEFLHSAKTRRFFNNQDIQAATFLQPTNSTQPTFFNNDFGAIFQRKKRLMCQHSRLPVHK